MKTIMIVYWSGTGNTEELAKTLAEGAKEQGGQVQLLDVGKASVQEVLQADVIALGCPSMGCEELEEDEMEPFVQALEQEDLTDKPLFLFGSYDWGDGEWMRDWEARMLQQQVVLAAESFIVQNDPSLQQLDEIKKIGAKLAAL